MGSGQSSHLPNRLVVYSAPSPKISNRELTGRLYAEGYLGISGLSPIRCCSCSKGFLTFQIHKDSKMTGRDNSKFQVMEMIEWGQKSKP